MNEYRNRNVPTSMNSGTFFPTSESNSIEKKRKSRNKFTTQTAAIALEMKANKKILADVMRIQLMIRCSPPSFDVFALFIFRFFHCTTICARCYRAMYKNMYIVHSTDTQCLVCIFILSSEFSFSCFRFRVTQFLCVLIMPCFSLSSCMQTLILLLINYFQLCC